MIRLTALPVAAILIAAASSAEEFTVESRPFAITTTFAATAMPADGGGSVLLSVAPKAWTDFKLVQLAGHGSRVAKGEVLVRFDAEAIDQNLEDSRRSSKDNLLNLAQAELDLKHLQETAPHTLDGLLRAAEIATEENEYFTRTRREAAEAIAGHGLERKKQVLENQQEELRQLAKMYAADDLTEDTEEIILTRQKDAVAAAQLALRMETLDYKRTMEIALPREAVTLANNERDAAIALRKAEQDIPRAIELKKSALLTLRTTHQRETKRLAELEADRALFEIQAPADGWFYHGPIENGRWTPAEAVKTLFEHGRPPAFRPFATFVPASAKFALVAFLDDSHSRSLKAELSGVALLAGREDLEIPVKLTRIAAAPGPDGTYRADLSATWPAGFSMAAGAAAQIHMISYQQPAAIAIPSKALAYRANGWSVDVKLADGKTESRPVKRGRVSKDSVEILSGLEIGQVLVIKENGKS